MRHLPGSDALMELPTAQIQAIVQQLVQEHGEYLPIELLLASNLVDYEGYREWRQGRLGNLDGALAGGEHGVITCLDKAAEWANALSLSPEPAEHHGWKDNDGTVLSPSGSQSLNDRLNIRFRRSTEVRQSDLFLDSAPTAALTGLVNALVSGDADKARESLDRLVRVEPGHRHRGHAVMLISALKTPPPGNIRQGIERLERMTGAWLPAASDLLGIHRRDFLAPLWRDIGKALEPAKYDPNCPEHHASRAYRAGLDWEGVKRSVLAVPEHEGEAVLLVRLAEAHLRLRDRAAAIGTWFTLCHARPEAFERLVETTDFPDWSLQRAWRNAQEQELEPELTPAWFPAWMLLEEPGLAGLLAPRRTDDAPSRAFDTLKDLLAHPGPDERGMEIRLTLKQIHPGLLERFLAKQVRSASHLP